MLIVCCPISTGLFKRSASWDVDTTNIRWIMEKKLVNHQIIHVIIKRTDYWSNHPYCLLFLLLYVSLCTSNSWHVRAVPSRKKIDAIGWSLFTMVVCLFCSSCSYPTGESSQTVIIIDSPCGPNEVMCRSGSCVPAAAVCDGRPDCPDGSDELPPRCCKSNNSPLWSCHQFSGKQTNDDNEATFKAKFLVPLVFLFFTFYFFTSFY